MGGFACGAEASKEGQAKPNHRARLDDTTGRPNNQNYAEQSAKGKGKGTQTYRVLEDLGHGLERPLEEVHVELLELGPGDGQGQVDALRQRLDLWGFLVGPRSARGSVGYG